MQCAFTWKLIIFYVRKVILSLANDDEVEDRRETQLVVQMR